VFGGFLAVMPALSTLFFGAKNQAANYGVLFTGYGLGAIVALFAGAFVRTETGSYLDAFYLSAFLAVIGIALSLSVRPPKPVAVKVERPIPAQA
jgi:OFA family oxalate/formate antiporter-like MFS transporter